MVKDAVKVYQDKLDNLAQWSNKLEFELDSLVEKQVNEQLEAKQQELQVNLNHALEQAYGDYQSKIDDQKDIIARLQDQLNRLNASDDIAASQQLIAINQQIASQQAALTGLQQQYDDTAARLVIDDGFADTADHLSKEVSAFIKELLISYSGDKAIYPQAALSDTNKNKMLHAARAFRDACDGILNLHWGQK
jgi:chromosome segregation ATPase